MGKIMETWQWKITIFYIGLCIFKWLFSVFIPIVMLVFRDVFEAFLVKDDTLLDYQLGMFAGK